MVLVKVVLEKQGCSKGFMSQCYKCTKIKDLIPVARKLFKINGSQDGNGRIRLVLQRPPGRDREPLMVALPDNTLATIALLQHNMVNLSDKLLAQICKFS